MSIDMTPRNYSIRGLVPGDMTPEQVAEDYKKWVENCQKGVFFPRKLRNVRRPREIVARSTVTSTHKLHMPDVVAQGLDLEEGGTITWRRCSDGFHVTSESARKRS